MSHVAGYSPVLGNNQFGYPSGGVVRTPSFKKVEEELLMVRKSFHERWKSLKERIMDGVQLLFTLKKLSRTQT